MESLVDNPVVQPTSQISDLKSEMPGSPIDRERTWPLEARMALFVLEAGGASPPSARVRALPRQAFRVMGTICEKDPHALKHVIVYIRDVDSGHLGFISQSDLPVGRTVWLHCSVEDGRTIDAPCRIGRSRGYMSGWIEGVLHVESEQVQSA